MTIPEIWNKVLGYHEGSKVRLTQSADIKYFGQTGKIKYIGMMKGTDIPLYYVLTESGHLIQLVKGEFR